MPKTFICAVDVLGRAPGVPHHAGLRGDGEHHEEPGARRDVPPDRQAGAAPPPTTSSRRRTSWRARGSRSALSAGSRTSSCAPVGGGVKTDEEGARLVAQPGPATASASRSHGLRREARWPCSPAWSGLECATRWAARVAADAAAGDARVVNPGAAATGRVARRGAARLLELIDAVGDPLAWSRMASTRPASASRAGAPRPAVLLLERDTRVASAHARSAHAQILSASSVIRRSDSAPVISAAWAEPDRQARARERPGRRRWATTRTMR